MSGAGAPSLRRTEWAIMAGVLVFAGGFAAAALWAGGRHIWDIVLRVPPRIVPVLLAFSLLNYALRGARWLLFSRALGLAVPPGRGLLYYVAGFAMTTTPDKMGEIVRLYLMRRYHGCPYDRSTALLIADRLSDGVAAILVVALTVGGFAHLPGGAALAIVFAAMLLTICLKPSLLLLGLHAAYARLGRWPRLFVRARRLVRALQDLARPQVFGAALVLGAIGWASEAVSFAVLLHVMGVALPPAAGLFIFAFSMLVGALSFLPGGLGSTEATMVGLLSLQGVPLDSAIVATGIVRVTTLWFAVLLGLLALPVAFGAGVARMGGKAPIAVV